MEMQTIGRVVAVKKQWWLKVNRKPVRLGPLDGATFPHIIKVEYTVNGTLYSRRKWLGASCTPPLVGTEVTVFYSADRPAKARLGI